MFASRASAARDFERSQISAVGTCKTARGQEFEIEYRDISQGGCRVDDLVGGMSLGAHVSLFIEGTGPIRAEVAWRQGDRVGLEFLQLLPDRVYRHLIRQEWDLARRAPLLDGRVYTVRRII